MSRALFEQLESFYDAVPRANSRVEEHGPLVLFVRDGEGYPYYARPALPQTGTPTAADVLAVRERQRELGIPQAFEWVHETTPDLLAAAEEAGLKVLKAPLLVLDALVEPDPVDAVVRVLDPEAPDYPHDLALVQTVARLAFSTPGTAVGEAGARDRETLLPTVTPFFNPVHRNALAEDEAEGAVAAGTAQRAGDVVEIVGVGTLPSARRRGLGAAITAALAEDALDRGASLVFLSAGDDDIAKVYERVGFRRIGTACIAEAD
jgi:GNAT superfamily N-acetyltransferase